MPKIVTLRKIVTAHVFQSVYTCAVLYTLWNAWTILARSMPRKLLSLLAAAGFSCATVTAPIAQAPARPHFDCTLVGDVDAEHVNAVAMCLAQRKGLDTVMVLNSPGGSVDAAFCLIAQMEAHGKVDCLVPGMAASSAALILQACRVRVMRPDAKVLIHKPSNLFMLKASELERLLSTGALWYIVEDLQRTEVRMFMQYLSRSVLDPMVTMEAIGNGDLVLSAQEALSVGLIDRIEP